MGLQNTSGNMSYLKIVEDKDEKSSTFGRRFFGLQEKKGGVWSTTNTYNKLTGKLVEVGHGSYEWEGEDVLTWYMVVKDGEDKYKIETNFNVMTRSMLNSLASIEDFSQEISFSLYQNKEGYNQCYIEMNGERVEWAYGFDKLPKPKEVKVGKKKLMDYSEVDEKFVSMIDKVISPKMPVQVQESMSSDTEDKVVSEEEDNDLPF